MKMKRVILTLLSVAFAWSVLAQQGTVKATVWDEEARTGIPGAVVEVSPKAKPDRKKFYTSGFDGVLSLAGLAYGNYTLSVSFLGYETATVDFKLDASVKNLGRIGMRTSATQIETVVKEVQSMRASQKGDTLSYNAGAFKVAADADVEGLLKKMPGITVSNGTVEAQGEEVKKVFVDGKEFFGEDVTTAIQSLPAEAVDRVEVYNKLSDNAEFSGMDDGEGYKAINIVTHRNMRQGQFGKMYVGYGYDFEPGTETRSKYLAGGNVNIFSGDSRLSVIGLFNNVNQQNFSFEDILGVTGSTAGRHGVGQYMMRPQSGVATVNAVGLNYSDTWGKRDQVTFQGSYFFNNTRTKNLSTRDRWSEFQDEEDLIQRDTLWENGRSVITNSNHRLNARIEWKISDNQSLMSRSGFSYQSNAPWSLTEGRQWGDSGYSNIYSQSEADRAGYSIREFLQYRAKLGKIGRTITIDGDVRYSDYERTSDSWSNQAPAGAHDYPPLDLLYQQIKTPTMSYQLRGNFTYTEPVSKYAQLSLQYRARYEYSESDRRSYTEDNQTGGLALNTNLSNSNNSGYMTHRIGPGFRWAKERNTFVANLNYQRGTLDGEMIYPTAERIRHTYDNFTYFVMANIQFNRENSIRMFLHSSTEAPGITDLQSVYDISNPQYITRGNPELNPSYSHTVRFHYVNSNLTKGRTFMWMFSLRNTSDYIATNVEYNPGAIEIDGVQYLPLQFSSPVNLDGYWNLRTHLSYGFPLNFMKCNLNLMAGVSYSLVPSQINSQRNDASNIGYDANVVLGSNISENIDFTVSWMGTYNEAKNSLLSTAGKNRYFNHSANLALKWTFWKGMTLTGSASYVQYKGFTTDYNDEYLLCNVYLGKKVFKNRRGEVQIGVNDLLNQNRSFVRTTGSGWTQNATNSVIGRYYMVQFVYNLRHFGKRGSRNMADYDTAPKSDGGRRPMGPPPGGFRGGPGPRF